MQKNATVSVCNKFTQNLADFTKKADILITAVGKKNLITREMVKEGAIAIDAGIGFENKKLFGDINFASAKQVAGWIAPVPGGVGPMTVACLMENTLIAFKRQLGL